MKVLIFGAGTMVEAILTGLKNETDLSQFYIYTPSGTRAKELAKKVGANFALTMDEVVDPAFVWLGCKPQQLGALAESISGKFSNSTFVSMLAALSEQDQLKVLGAKRLIRIMPNLPVKYKKGVTLISSETGGEDIKKVSSLFSLIGLAQTMQERELEELTLLTGSGPALFYEFTKYLADSFSSLNEYSREQLARMVLSGSGISVDEGEDSLIEMIDKVTSKGGVSIAVLEEWRRLKIQEEIKLGVGAGLNRTAEIKDLLRHN